MIKKEAMEFYTCNIKLEVGREVELEDKETGRVCKGKVIREATKQEYLDSRPNISSPLNFFYLMALD